MKMIAKPMDEDIAWNIATWQYEPPYDFYNSEQSHETIDEMLDGSYYAVLNEEQEVIGFYCTGQSAIVPAGYTVHAYEDGYIDMGLGMHPALVGQGNGYAFGLYIIGQIKEKYDKPLRLTVASFNKRAIRLYKKLGFVEDKVFHTSRTEFITMKAR